MDKIPRGDASVLEDASLLRSKELTLIETYLKEFCPNVVMGSVAPSIGLIDSICIEPLDLTPPLKPLYLPPLPLMFMHFLNS